MNERRKSRPTITERIKLAKETLGVTRDEIEKELARCFDQQNVSGVQEMFNAYLSWELREGPMLTDRKPDELTLLAFRNMDIVAKVADRRRSGKDDFSVLTAAVESNFIGPIQQFYRDIVGFHPEQPADTLN